MTESPVKPILCLDFDGVLHSYTSRWQGPDIIPDEPTPGMVEFLAKAIDAFDVRVYSSRSNHDGGRAAMRAWLRMHVLRHFDCEFHQSSSADLDKVLKILCNIFFAEGKPEAFLTIDDRALCFTGKWPSIESLLAFKPWNKP